MKKLMTLVLLGLIFTGGTPVLQAGAVRWAAKKAWVPVPPAARGLWAAGRWSAATTTYPARHPKRSARGLGQATKKTARAIF